MLFCCIVWTMNQYYLPWRAGALYHATHVRDGAQLVELMRVAFELKPTFAPLVVMIRQVHGTFSASTSSTPTWVSENNQSTDGGRVSTTCGRNPGFQAERGFLVRLIRECRKIRRVIFESLTKYSAGPFQPFSTSQIKQTSSRCPSRSTDVKSCQTGGYEPELHCQLSPPATNSAHSQHAVSIISPRSKE